MAGKRMQALFLVVCLAAAAQCCRGEDAEQAMNNAADTANSWADWAYSKFTEGAEKARNLAEKKADVSYDTQNRNLAEQVADTTKGAAQSLNSAAGETMNSAKTMVQDKYVAAKDAATTKVQDTYVAAKDSMSGNGN